MPDHPDLLADTVERPARLFQRAAVIEGATLLLLACVAVPVKYLAGEPALVKAMGPVHGAAFLAYVWTLMQLQGAAGWPRKHVALLLAAAFIPFGSMLALSRLRRAGSQPRGRQP